MIRRVFHEQIDSTSLDAKRRYDGAALLVVAAEQTAGMGRLGRTWQSPRGGLWMSLAWPMREPLTAYQAAPLAVGAAVAEAIGAVCEVSAEIKWPNDLLVNERKLAGILCQTELDRNVLVVGIGINANLSCGTLPEDLRRPPTSLRDERGSDVDLLALEVSLVERLQAAIEACEQGRFGTDIAPRVHARLCWRGKRVRSTDGAGTVFTEGVLAGIDASGALILETEVGQVAVTVGEIARI